MTEPDVVTETPVVDTGHSGRADAVAVAFFGVMFIFALGAFIFAVAAVR